MTGDEATSLVIDALEALGIPYAIWCDLHGTRELLEEIKLSIPSV